MLIGFLGVSTPTKAAETPQRVQILRGPDGKIQVRGLLPGQQLIQMPDGKLHVLSTNQAPPGTPATSKSQPALSPTKTVIKSSNPKPNANGAKVVNQSPTKQPQQNNTLLIRQQQQQVNSPVVQKVAQPNNTVVSNSGQQVLTGQQVIVGNQQVIAGQPAQVFSIFVKNFNIKN